jgi:hypothetical protein
VLQPDAARFMRDFGTCSDTGDLQLEKWRGTPGPRSDPSENLSKSQIQSVVHDHEQEVTWCYQSMQFALFPPPATPAQGRLVVDFVIAPDGHVDAVQIHSTELDVPSLGCCLISKIRAWRFPRPTAGIVVVSYPFHFLLDTPANRRWAAERQRKSGSEAK